MNYHSEVWRKHKTKLRLTQGDKVLQIPFFSGTLACTNRDFLKEHSKIETIFSQRPSKMMKNAFYFTSKALLVLKIFELFLDSLVMQKNGLIRKIRLISNL